MNFPQFLLTATELTENFTRAFTEIDLANKLSLDTSQVSKTLQEDERELFRITTLKKTSCPKCNELVELADSQKIFCSNCNTELITETLPKHQITLNYLRVKNFFQNYTLQLFQENNWTIESSDDTIAVLTKDSLKIALSINLRQILLQDYFLLRGWAIETHPESYLLIGLNFDFLLAALSEKDLKCTVCDIRDILQSNDLNWLQESLIQRNKLVQKTKELEKQSKLVFGRFGDLIEIKKHIEDVLSNLPGYALQTGEANPSTMGNRFQEYIISLLNLTLFRAKLKAGPNQPDGIIYFFNEQKPRWYLIELKTFKPKKDEFYPLQESTLQIKKYATAFKKADISEEISTPAYVIIAYDFDWQSKETQALVTELEKSTGMRIILFPLKSIVKMVRLFLQHNIAHLPSEEIESLFSRTGYISPEMLDELFKRLVKYNKEKSEHIFRRVRQYVKVQGR